MASPSLTSISSKPFTSPALPSLSAHSRLGFRTNLRRTSLKVNAITAKVEPSKVIPQADRVLLRLEQLPEIFHDLHEEVMVTAARGHTLMVRVQQLESEFPPIEKAILSQTSHSAFYGSTGIDWHPNLQMNQNLITKGDLPRFVMDSYEECRGPPRLFLLDKFDVAGAGACLKRYTDPSFYKVESSAYEMASTDVQRDKRIRKAKKKGLRLKNGDTPEVLPSTKLHQLFLEERVESGASDPARLVKLKRKPNASALGSDNGKSYMEKFLKTPEDKVVCEVVIDSPHTKSTYNSTIESGLEMQVLDISTAESDLERVSRKRDPYPPPSLGTTVSRLSDDDFCEDITEERTSELPTSNPCSVDKDIAVNGEVKVDKREIYQSDDDNASEIDNYTDALATLESEVETGFEFRAKSDDVAFLNTGKHEIDSDANDEQLQNQSQFSDSQSLANSSASDDGNSSIRKGVSSFSCSDTASTSAEIMPLIGEVDAPCISSHQDSVSEKVRVDLLSEHEVSSGDYIEQTGVHADSTPMVLHVGSGSISIEDQSGGLESDDLSSSSGESSSGPMKSGLQMDDNCGISSDLKKNKEQRTDYDALVSSGPMKTEEPPLDDNVENFGCHTTTEEQQANVDNCSQKREEITPILLCEEDPKSETKVFEPTLGSSAGLDSANALEMVREKEGSETSLDDVVQDEFTEDVSAGDSVDTLVMSPDSVISHAEEHPSVQPLAEFKMFGTCNLVEEQLAEKGTCNLVEEQLAEKADEDLSDKYDLGGIDIADSRERNLDGTWEGELLHLGENDAEGGDSKPGLDLLSSDFRSGFPESPDHPSKMDDHGQSDERDKETIQLEAMVERASDSSLAENPAQSDEKEHEIVQSEAAERAPDSSVASEAKGSLYHNSNITLSSFTESNFESESHYESSLIENTEDASLFSHCIPSKTSLGEKVELQTGELDLRSLITHEESPELEHIDSPSHKDHYTDSNTNFDSCALTLQIHPLDHEEIQTEESDVISLQVGGVASPEFSSQLENIDSPSLLDHKPDINADIDSGVLILPTHSLDQEEELQAEEPEVGSLQMDELTRESSRSEQVELTATDHESSSAPLSVEVSVAELSESSSHDFDLSEQDKFPLNSPFSGFNVLPEVSQHDLEEMPPLPPLPPMQWRVGKLHHSSMALERDGDQHDNDLFPPFFPSKPNELVQPSNRFLPLPGMNFDNSCREDLNAVNSTPPLPQVPTINHSDHRDDFLALGQPQSSDLSSTLLVTYNERPPHTFAAEDGKLVQPTCNTFTPAITLMPTSMYSSETPHGEVTQSPQQLSTEVSVKKEQDDRSSAVSDMILVGPPKEFLSQPTIEKEQPGHAAPTSEEETVSSSSTSVFTSLDDEKSNGNRPMKLPRPRSPLIDAVAAHDKSKLRKVTERVWPEIQKVEERDSLLEQIRAKSFNLKPAVATRPTIQGPRTNLRVAAILEKANAIRQAFAGSDDDDDDDSWSDS